MLYSRVLSISIYRYKWWLEKLADISLRQSAAYGFWNFNFNTLYHSTQVWLRVSKVMTISVVDLLFPFKPMI